MPRNSLRTDLMPRFAFAFLFYQSTFGLAFWLCVIHHDPSSHAQIEKSTQSSHALFDHFSHLPFSFSFFASSNEQRTTPRARPPSSRVEWKRLKHASSEGLQKSTVLRVCHRERRDDTNGSLPVGLSDSRSKIDGRYLPSRKNPTSRWHACWSS